VCSRLRARATTLTSPPLPSPPHIPPNLRRGLLTYSAPILQSVFGYEVVPSVDTDTNVGDGYELAEVTPPSFVVRLHRDAAGKERGGNERLAAHSAGLMMGRARERAAARRGLLMAVLTLILGSKDLRIHEEDLFRLLKALDPTLPGTGSAVGAGARGGRGKGAGAAAASSSSSSSSSSAAAEGEGEDGEEEADEDAAPRGKSGAGAGASAAAATAAAAFHPLADWRTAIREEFVRAGYLEHIHVQPEDGGGAGAGAGGGDGGGSTAKNGFRMGVRTRSVLGATGLYEFATSVKNGAAPAAGGAGGTAAAGGRGGGGRAAAKRPRVGGPDAMTSDGVSALLGGELGDFVRKLPRTRMDAVVEEVAGGGDGEDGGAEQQRKKKAKKKEKDEEEEEKPAKEKKPAKAKKEKE
jgi:hypothetical protein